MRMDLIKTAHEGQSMTEDTPASSSPLPPGDDRTRRLLKYEAWLRLLARNEIDSRFAGKFDASDAVQQTLLEAWKDWDNFRGDAEAQRLAWLRQILAHQLARLARHYAGTQKRDVTRELSVGRASVEQSLSQSAERFDALIAAGDPSPSQQAAADEQRLALARALESLPDDYRQVILLRNLEDLPHEEVARRMHRSPGAVRMLWVRALAALRDAMQADL
jgi:RNA polymerase sigma-70 factor (ECF subfamily)